MQAPAERTDPMLLSSETVFVQEGLMLPESMCIETSVYSPGWRQVTTDRQLLDATIAAAGWHFFFTVGKMEGSAFGALTSLNLRRAMRSILRHVKEQNFNAVQITAIKSRKAFGLIRYIGVSAHARHIQKSVQLDNDQQRKIAREQSAWAVG
jgi:hypothetical protein